MSALRRSAASVTLADGGPGGRPVAPSARDGTPSTCARGHLKRFFLPELKLTSRAPAGHSPLGCYPHLDAPWITVFANAFMPDLFFPTCNVPTP